MKKWKKLVSGLLCMIMLVTSLNITVSAEEQAETNTGKTNLTIIADEDGYMEYTYQENGKNYKIKENELQDAQKILTDVYIMNESGKYIRIDSYITQFEYKSDALEVKVIRNGELVEKFEMLEDGVIVPEASTRATPPPPAGGEGGWVFSATYKGSTKFYNMTISAIKNTLTSLAGGLGKKYFGEGAGMAASAITNIATDLFLKEADYAYLKQSIYYYYPPKAKVPTKGRTTTYCYLDSKYSVFLGSFTEEFSVILGGN